MSTQTVESRTGEHTAYTDSMNRPAARMLLGVLRILFGFIFLWAFLDKTFGLGKATPSENAWIDGGDPTYGYLSNNEGTFASLFTGLAGAGETLGVGTWWKQTSMVRRMPILR